MSAKTADMPRIGEPEKVRKGENYSAVRLGAACDWTRYGVRHPALPKTIHGKVFLKSLIDLTGMEISCGVIPKRGGMPVLHKHRENEEVYVFMSGQGQMLVDGDAIDVGEGCVVRVAPAGVRSWRNTTEEPLVYLVIQAKAGSLTQWTATDGVGVEGTPEWPEG